MSYLPESSHDAVQSTRVSSIAKDDNISQVQNPWFVGITSLFVGASDDIRHDRYGSHGHGTDVPFGEERDDIDDESTASASVAPIGDDLKSLPSVNDSVAGEDESIASFDSFAGMQQENRLKSFVRSASRTDNVEAVVEMKISNIKVEGSSSETEQSIPYLKKKMFPNTSGRELTKDDQVSNKALESRRQILVQELRSAVNEFGRYDVRCANVTAALGDLYNDKQEYKQAIRLHEDTVSVYSALLGDDNSVTLGAKNRLGKVLQNAGEFDEAISIFFSVACMLKGLKGDKHPEAADKMVDVAGVLRQKGSYEHAIKTLKRALKVYREVLGDSDPSVSRTVDEIASLYVAIDDFEKASAILEEVVKLKAATFGVNSRQVASTVSELATCYEYAENYSKAMKNLKKAYKIYADVDGEYGSQAILVLERIALIYQATGQFKKAAIAYLGVLRGRKRALGESHPTVADTYFHLGVSLRESSQHDKALRCMKQALNIYVGEGKEMHDVEMIAEVMHELAIIHKANKRMNDAIKAFKQEIAVRRKLGQSDYPLISQTLNHLGVAEYESKNHSKALKYFMEALTIHEKNGDESGTDFAEVLYNTGLVLESSRDYERAKDAYIEAARLFKVNGYEDSHPHLSKTVSKLKKLGHVCRCQGTQCGSVPCISVLSERHSC